MGEQRSPHHRALVRAAADRLAGERGARGDHARGILAALDWLEGRCDTAPSSNRQLRPEAVVERYSDHVVTALHSEIAKTEDWGQGLGREPIGASLNYHGAVWSTLRWSQNRDHGLAIDVPGLVSA